jgi:HK97 family phage portal protein
MAIVRSFGRLQSFGEPTPNVATVGRPSSWDSMSASTYGSIYRTQPNVRTVVEFLGRNIAQIGLHVFRRVNDLDRARLYDHELAQWVAKPNPATTRYRLIDSTIQDLGVYFNAYWLKVRMPDRLGLVRLPPEQVTPDGWLMPASFAWTLPDNRVATLASSEVVYFNGYDPCDPIAGFSPLETLRRILMEDAAQTTYRQQYWQNSARLEGVITRPAAVPKWTPEQKQSFREQWQARFAGAAGQTAVLEDGMTFTPTSYSARDSEFTAVRKLTREEVAAAYHIPLPMVGILDHATFSNIKEQHKQLYQDCLGPWLVMLQEELERQLLIECADQENVYLEFNIAEKLKGSFEEQAAALQMLVGRPVMTANEGRARLNLPSIKDDPTANQIAMPLNQTTGGTPTLPPDGNATAVAVGPVLRATWDRQRASLARVRPSDRPVAFKTWRWDRELADDLAPALRASGCPESDIVTRSAALASTVNTHTLQLLAAGRDPFVPARDVAPYGDVHA